LHYMKKADAYDKRPAVAKPALLNSNDEGPAMSGVERTEVRLQMILDELKRKDRDVGGIEYLRKIASCAKPKKEIVSLIKRNYQRAGSS